jgi:hypothetical protein
MTRPALGPEAEADARRVLRVSLRQGFDRNDACGLAGITVQEFEDWLAEDEPFRVKCERAETNALRRGRSRLKRLSYTDWRAARALLAMTDPENWGPLTPEMLEGL